MFNRYGFVENNRKWRHVLYSLNDETIKPLL